MNDPIASVFKDRSTIKIMTHVVAGYPDLKTNIEVITAMAESGADLVEIQIPFSDPLADGATIMKANQHALDNSVTPDDCFRLAKEVTSKVNIPILFMTYGNIPFSTGMENFIKECVNSGITGTIIPDLPFDEQIDNYISLADKYNVHPIQVISPGISKERLIDVIDKASGFIYTTLKVGITGAGKELDPKAISFLNDIKKQTDIPVAAGFGISSPEHVAALKGKVDAAVIGSHIINLLDTQGLPAVRKFISECKSV